MGTLIKSFSGAEQLLFLHLCLSEASFCHKWHILWVSGVKWAPPLGTPTKALSPVCPSLSEKSTPCKFRLPHEMWQPGFWPQMASDVRSDLILSPIFKGDNLYLLKKNYLRPPPEQNAHSLVLGIKWALLWAPL